MVLLQTFFYEILYILQEMSIYLIIGFLVASILHVFFPDSLVQKHTGKKGLLSIIKATLIGIPLPICSCGVIPVATSLNKKGASKGASMAFLISTPQVGVDSFMISYSMLGPFFSLFRVIAAVITSLFAGVLTDFFDKSAIKDKNVSTHNEASKERLKKVHLYFIYELFGSIAKYLIIGIILAAAITTFIPEDFVSNYLGNRFLSYFFVLLISIPLYICATSSTPVAASLVLKGFSPGTAIVFLLAGPATNVVTISTVLSVFGKKSTFIYLFSIISVSVATGLALDYFLIDFAIENMVHNHQGLISHTLKNIGVVILISLFVLYYFLTLKNKYFHSKKKSIVGNFPAYKVDGMTCNHCKASVDNAVKEVVGEKINYTIDLSKGILQFDDNVDDEKIVQTITSKGFRCTKMGIIEYKVSGMNCNHCKNSVEKCVKESVGENITFNVDLTKESLIIDSSDINFQEIEEKITNAGFTIERK